LAKVVSKRARKGFNVRYNPDQHWSSSLYAGLDKLQYEDGSNIVNIGRDDQAGFRLDTMATHKLHATLCVKGSEHITTRTDYVNKYPSNLQTTSYNFSGTKKTSEICAGIVKAPLLFGKNAAQHFGDLEMLEKKEEVRAAFINPFTGKRKEVECVRVDGSYDEGPSHIEVQYWWTVRHLNTKSRMLLVTSRNSGASYRNRVELQNGCLALAHANLFIPSTLNGSCLSSGGKINEEVLRENLSSAIEVYLSRVDKAPCAGTEINLFRGADSTNYQNENGFVITYLKGTLAQKEKLKEDHPNEYSKVKRIWDLRKRHLKKNVPAKYIFCLTCCYQPNCIHPLCQQGAPAEEPRWYPNGPPLSFLPLPAPDPKRRYDWSECKDCKEKCSGHYYKVDDLWQQVSQGKDIQLEPPSQVILNEFNFHLDVPDENRILEVSEKVLLPYDETKMWFDHLKTVAENRKRGVAKAAETRRAKSGKRQEEKRGRKQPTKRKNQDKNKGKQSLESRCSTCKMDEPPEVEGEEVDWICCDSCVGWHHMPCVGITSDDAHICRQWLCPNCVESWQS
jgi:hypothetical protein